MKLKSQNAALRRLSDIRESFREQIEANYEVRAKNCLTCEVQGDCCTDAHFVNVHVSKLEAVAIGEAINALNPEVRERVFERNKKALASVDEAKDSFDQTYSCPLFEKGIGCLVHQTSKPLPCINHACYENKKDLPPSSLMRESELKINRLNDRVFGKSWNWLPIPVWISRVMS